MSLRSGSILRTKRTGRCSMTDYFSPPLCFTPIRRHCDFLDLWLHPSFETTCALSWSLAFGSEYYSPPTHLVSFFLFHALHDSTSPRQ